MGKISQVCLLFLFSIFFCLPVQSQSTIEYQSETTIEVASGADICADNIIINGTYSGSGTKCGSLLPVELISFTANVRGKAVEMKWNTATEVNNYGFEIERKTIDNEKLTMDNWVKIGFIEGSGTTNSPKSYSFVDASANGRVFYRLKQIDRDGKLEYSQEIEVTMSGTPKEFALVQNYPNPFNPSTMISYQLPMNGHVTLKVYDAIGREVVTLVNEVKEVGSYSTQFDGTKLSSGIYFARLQSGDKVQLKKIVLMK